MLKEQGKETRSSRFGNTYTNSGDQDYWHMTFISCALCQNLVRTFVHSRSVLTLRANLVKSWWVEILRRWHSSKIILDVHPSGRVVLPLFLTSPDDIDAPILMAPQWTCQRTWFIAHWHNGAWEFCASSLVPDQFPSWKVKQRRRSVYQVSFPGPDHTTSPPQSYKCVFAILQ